MSPSSNLRLLRGLLFAIGAGAASSCGAPGTPGEQGEDDVQGTQTNGANAPDAETSSGPPAGGYECSYGAATIFCASARASSAAAPAAPLSAGAPALERYDDSGCLKQQFVASSCCNPAVGPGWREGEQCCYQACDSVCCGRALVIAERVLVSEAEQRSDWLVPDATLVGVAHASRPELTPAERARLVELWQGDALMEHASIASFARFGLQLLALGAPAQLVRQAQQAGLDEVRHAEHAFSIASRLAGRAIGPGKLPELEGGLDTSLVGAARAALVEGCIGETFAAVLAREQARLAGDESTRQALSEVAEDEARHAELSFRFVAWALAQGGPELHATLRDEAERRLARLPEPSATAAVSLPALHHYGRPSAAEQRTLYWQTREWILRPALAALFEPSARGASTVLRA